MATQGFTTVDFGSDGSLYTSVAVTGQAGILAATSSVEAWVRPIASASHTADEHLVDPPRITAGDIVNATGFTIHAFSYNTLRHYGIYNVAWVWN